jgi:hypothetical protein
MAQQHQADPKLRGIVGENFLGHFDFLIDNGHRALCLDASGLMASAIKGSHLPLEQPYGPDRDLPFTRPFVIATQLAGESRPCSAWTPEATLRSSTRVLQRNASRLTTHRF